MSFSVSTLGSTTKRVTLPLGGLDRLETQVYFCLGIIEHMLYNSLEKNNRFIIDYMEAN